MNRLKIGIAQINPTVGDFAGNLKKCIQYIKQADRSKCDLIVFPELAVSGYPVWDLANRDSFVKEGLRSLKRLVKESRDSQVAIVIGFIDKSKKKDKSLNALAVIHRGRIIHRHNKILLPTYDVFLEQIFFESGQHQSVFTFKGVKIAASICEDVWDDSYSVKPIEDARKHGAELLINISASPFHGKSSQVRRKLISRKAKENKMDILYVNQVGGQDELIFDGRSFAVDERGSVYFEAPSFIEGLFSLEWTRGSGKKKDIPVKDPHDVGEIYKALVLGLRDYVRKNNFTQVVLGLSGGIDSALVASLATDALGPEAVLGLSMPGPFSSKGSVSDAKELASHLGIELREKSIKNLYQTFKRQAKFGKLTLAEENLQARLRGLELMYVSNKEGRLLLTTGNKSEMAMGYCTLYGDMCGGLGVLGDVYKMDVYRLCRWRNKIFPVIPENTLLKPPSAELRPNQKDVDSLPPYEKLDQILYHYIEKNKTVSQIKTLLKGKVSRSIIDKTIQAVSSNEYKRRQSPPVLRVSEKAWFGRRMPVTNAFREG
jgi:NAD+ synthase (glutamine-hydrolysing)